jgi:hypothetical protein
MSNTRKILQNISRQESSPGSEVQFRLFTDNDYAEYAGVDDPEGGKPLIAQKDAKDGGHWEIVVSRDAVHVYTVSGDDISKNNFDLSTYAFQTPFAQGKGIAAQAARCDTEDELLQMGFDKIG